MSHTHFEVQFPCSADITAYSSLGSAIVNVVHPDLKEPHNFKFFTEGITNKILCVWSSAAGEDDRVLFRIFGENTELIIDRDAEIKNMRLLHQAGFAPPLYATFNNGLVYGYVPGCVLDWKLVREYKYYRLIARQLAHIHSTVKPQVDHVDPFFDVKTLQYIGQLNTINFTEPDRQQRFAEAFPLYSSLLNEFEEIKRSLHELKLPIVFCHNDLLTKNIIYDDKKDSVSFIDFEYAAYNYLAYDIGDHFCEFAGVDDVDFSRYPDEQLQMSWLREYLTAYNDYCGENPRLDVDLVDLYIAVNKCALASHFFWSIWAIIQAYNSSIDFDFLDYGIKRREEYLRMKKGWLNVSVP